MGEPKYRSDYLNLLNELDKPIEVYEKVFSGQKFSNAGDIPLALIKELKDALSKEGYTIDKFQELLSVFDGKYTLNDDSLLEIDEEISEYKTLILLLVFFYSILKLPEDKEQDDEQTISNAKIIVSELSKKIVHDYVKSKEITGYLTGKDHKLHTTIEVFEFSDEEVPAYLEKKLYYIDTDDGRVQHIQTKLADRKDIKMIQSIGNLYTHNHKTVTIRELYQNMNGGSTKIKPSVSEVKELYQRMLWMMRPITIDMTEEWNAYHDEKDQKDKYIRTVPLLPIEIIYSVPKGQSETEELNNIDLNTEIRIIEEPILYTESLFTHQNISVPITANNTSGIGGRCSDRKGAIKDYIIDFIYSQCRNYQNKTFSVIMHYKTLYKSKGIKTSPAQSLRDRKTIDEMLNNINAEIDFAEVIEHEKQKKGKEIIGEKLYIKKKAKHKPKE